MNIKIVFFLTDIHTSCHFDMLSDLKMARSVLVYSHYIIVLLWLSIFSAASHNPCHWKTPQVNSWVTDDKIYNNTSGLFSAETNCTLQPHSEIPHNPPYRGFTLQQWCSEKMARENLTEGSLCLQADGQQCVVRPSDRYWSRQADVKITFNEGKPQSHCQRCWHCCCVRRNLKQEAPSQWRGFMWL